jgi:hypothetical protein
VGNFFTAIGSRQPSTWAPAYASSALVSSGKEPLTARPPRWCNASSRLWRSLGGARRRASWSLSVSAQNAETGRREPRPRRARPRLPPAMTPTVRLSFNYCTQRPTTLTLLLNAAKRVCNRVCERARLESQEALGSRKGFPPTELCYRRFLRNLFAACFDGHPVGSYLRITSVAELALPGAVSTSARVKLSGYSGLCAN